MASPAYACVRKTVSTCPQCHQEIAAQIVERDGCIFMEKHCVQHGAFQLLVSRHPWFYKGLTGYYFEVMPEKMAQRRFYIYLTNKCNMNCPICLLDPNQGRVPDMAMEKFKEVIENNKNSRFYLYGAEPTLRPDLLDWIRLLKKNGNLVNMHTNGAHLTEYAYLKELKDGGLDYVSLQFDGFDDRIYELLRGEPLLENKMQVLENLRRLNMPTGLNVTIAKDVNEGQIGTIIDYAVRHPFIKDVSFATLSLLGSTCRNFSPDSMLMPDALIDMAEAQTKGRVSRQGIYLFQKLYYAFLAIFKIRRCYNFQHLALVRDKDGGYFSFDRLLGLEHFERSLDQFRETVRRHKLMASARLGVQLLVNFVSGHCVEKLSCIPWNMFMPGKLRSPKIPDKVLLISFGTVCDFVKYDAQISAYCGQGICLEKENKVVLTDNILELSMFSQKVCA